MSYSFCFRFISVSEKEIKELEQSYCQLYTSNNNHRQQQITAQIFSHVLTPVLPAVLIPGIFQAFDENRDGRVCRVTTKRFSYICLFSESIDFKELVCGMSAACRGPQFQRYKCKFHSFSIRIFH